MNSQLHQVQIKKIVNFQKGLSGVKNKHNTNDDK